ncbi:MAG: methyltransferase domain-containing protein [Hyphomicrobiaceae bacterium]
MSMCTLCNVTSAVALNDERKSKFEMRMVAALNEAAMVTMASLSHRTGLLDAMAGVPPSSTREIAARAGLNERYVREWLGAMVCSGVVETDAANATYWLPPEHAAFLTRTGDANLAVAAQFLPLLGAVESDVATCFRSGGGVPYARFDRFHEVMAEESGQTVLPALETAILPLVPGLQQRLVEGIEVLDVGCGRGRALLQMAESYPGSRFTGLDLSPEAIGWARTQAKERGLTNLTFETRDLSDFDVTADPGRYEMVTTFDAIHDQARPMALLKGIRRTLADGGVYLAQDIKGSGSHAGDVTHPLGTMLYTISCMHCMTVSLAQDGEGLGAMWGEPMARRMLAEAGFGSVEVHELDHDVMNYYYVCRP